MKGFTVVRGFAFVAVLALVLPTQALSQETTKAGVVTTLQGTASVARTSAKESRPLKFKDDIFVQDRITTGEDSIVRILLGGKAVVTVRERSVLTISETPTTATVEVGSGKVAVAVAKERMRAGDVLAGVWAAASVRGRRGGLRGERQPARPDGSVRAATQAARTLVQCTTINLRSAWNPGASKRTK